MWKGFRDLKEVELIEELPKLIAVQSVKSAAVSRTVQKLNGVAEVPPGLEIEKVRATTRADSISVDYPRDGLAAVRAVVETGGFCVTVEDKAIIETISLFPKPLSNLAFSTFITLPLKGKIA